MQCCKHSKIQILIISSNTNRNTRNINTNTAEGQAVVIKFLCKFHPLPTMQCLVNTGRLRGQIRAQYLPFYCTHLTQAFTFAIKQGQHVKRKCKQFK